MLSDNHIFKVVIVISQISKKKYQSCEKKTEKEAFFCLADRGMDLLEVLFFLGGAYFGLNLRQF
jgi:hypothetical protein